MRGRRRAAWVLAALALGCQDGGRTAATVVTAPADTLVQTVDEARHVRLDEELRVGGADAAGASFYRVGGAAFGPGGDLIVLDAGNHRVTVFGPEGTLLRSFGGQGQGPGEFERAQYMAVRGDSILVTDSGNRVHLFRTDGTLVHTRIHREMVEGGDTWILGPVGSAPDGLLLIASAYFRRDAEGYDGRLTPEPRIRAYRMVEDGDLEPTGLAWGHESRGQWSGGFWVSAPFAPRPTWGVDGLGRVHVTSGEDYSIDVYDATGTPVRTLANRIEGRPLDDDLMDLWKEAQCRSGPECDASRNELALSLPRPDFVPPIGALRGFQEGHLAVRRWDTDPEALTRRSRGIWDLYEPSGAYLGRLPEGVMPLAFDGRRLAALERGQNDEPFVVVYRVEPR